MSLTQLGDSYLSLVHLNDGTAEAVAKLRSYEAKCTDEFIENLLRDGDSWRERLTGTALASIRNINQFFDCFLAALNRSGGMSIVPLTAAITCAVQRGSKYEIAMTNSLDREAWDGEVGFAIDWMHYAMGMSNRPEQTLGPNFGQDFEEHLTFYKTLSE